MPLLARRLAGVSAVAQGAAKQALGKCRPPPRAPQGRFSPVSRRDAPRRDAILDAPRPQALTRSVKDARSHGGPWGRGQDKLNRPCGARSFLTRRFPGLPLAIARGAPWATAESPPAGAERVEGRRRASLVAEPAFCHCFARNSEGPPPPMSEAKPGIRGHTHSRRV